MATNFDTSQIQLNFPESIPDDGVEQEGLASMVEAATVKRQVVSRTLNICLDPHCAQVHFDPISTCHTHKKKLLTCCAQDLGRFHTALEAGLAYARAVKQCAEHKPLNYESLLLAEEAAAEAQARFRNDHRDDDFERKPPREKKPKLPKKPRVEPIHKRRPEESDSDDAAQDSEEAAAFRAARPKRARAEPPKFNLSRDAVHGGTGYGYPPAFDYGKCV
jgi:hypothetical protein